MDHQAGRAEPRAEPGPSRGRASAAGAGVGGWCAPLAAGAGATSRAATYPGGVPRYVATVSSPLSVEEAFAFLSDMRQYPSWDPSMSGARQVHGDGPGPDAEVLLEFGGVGPVRLSLRYAVVEYDPPHRMDIEARNAFVRSYDRVTVEPSGEGCLATYDATFRPRGPLRPLDALNGWWFRRLSDRAGAGLSHALGGTLVTA